MRREVAATLDAEDILRAREGTLGSAIERVVGVAPRLDVIKQARRQAPTWVCPPLTPGTTVLSRWTGYRLDGTELSRNLSYVDLSALHPDVASGLESGELHLGQLLASWDVPKSGFRVGSYEDRAIDAELRLGFTRDCGPYAWRRYWVSVAGRPAIVVVESLPLASWESLLSEVP